MAPSKKTDAPDLETGLLLITGAVETGVRQVLTALSAPRPAKRVPLAFVQLTKPMTEYALYTGSHDRWEHNKPRGLRLTLVGECVLVEGPPHERDVKRKERGVYARIPIASGLVSHMEDLVPFKHRLDPDEHYALVQSAADRTNRLAELEPAEPAPAVTKRAPATDKRATDAADTEAAKKEGITIGAKTNDEQELLDDELADEKASLVEDAEE